MSVRRVILIVITAIVVSGTAGFFYLSQERPRVNVLLADGSDSVGLMDFTSAIATNPPPDGWYHRIFKRHDPMEISFVTKDGRPSLRLATNDSGSIFARQVEIPLNTYPYLTWEWFIEQAVVSDLDERTVDGDDHPARLWLRFEDASGKDHAMEIIWGSKHLKKGDWKYLTFYYFLEFPHYTANGGVENERKWIREEVSLADVYRHQWGDPAGAKLIEIGIFCDTDETGAQSIAYFSNIRASKKAAGAPGS